MSPAIFFCPKFGAMEDKFLAMMRKYLKDLLLLFSALFLMGVQTVFAQPAPPFFNDIQRFNRADSLKFPPAGANLFIGSSSFTLWHGIEDYFPGKKIINRGFGGSSLPDLIRYRYDIIYPYAPKQIIMYCGENDIASSDTIQPQTVANRFFELYRLIRQKYPDIPFVYVSMKPSPSREKMMPRMLEANRQIEHFLSKEKNTRFVDVYHAMLQPNGKPKTDIWLDDKLHMNPQGYIIWQGLLRDILL